METHINTFVEKIGPRLSNITDHNNRQQCLVDLFNYVTGESLVFDNKELCDFQTDIDHMRALFCTWDVLTNGDLAGSLYQALSSHGDKKKKGQFFTPEHIVHQILDDALQTRGKTETSFTILDPSCGSGQFLIAAFKELMTRYAKSGIHPEDAAKIIVTKNLAGIDNDPVAAIIARYNLRSISGSEPNIVNNDFIYNNIHTNKYDIIIGNPPWGAQFSSVQKKYFRTKFNCAESGINSFTLFIEESLRALKENGCIAFLIPQAWLNIAAHKSSRLQVVETCTVNNITLWGDQFDGVYAPATSIVLQKSDRRNSHIVRIRDFTNGITNTETLIPQDYYTRTHENIFSITYSKKSVSIISRIDDQENLFLQNNASFFMGIVTGNNPEYIRKENDEEHPDPIIVGKDIARFRIQPTSNYFKYDPSRLQQTANRNLYSIAPKLVYKFIGKKLTFALDTSGRYMLNSVNAIVPALPDHTPQSVMAVLNSNVMQYYYEKNFFTVKVLKSNLQKLPIRKMDFDTIERLHDLSEQAMNTESMESYHRIIANIDDLVFHGYGIADREAYQIWEELNTQKSQTVLPGF